MSKKSPGGTKPTSSKEIQAQDELELAGGSGGASVPPQPPPQGQATSSRSHGAAFPSSDTRSTPPFASTASAASSPTPEAGASSSEQAERPVIAVSASKGPAAFFNLARKFLATDEMCDLSALEGAIVSAVDAAHLLERSKLAKITRIHTSYVIVEPKRKKQNSAPSQDAASLSSGATSPLTHPAVPSQPVIPHNTGGGPQSGVRSMGHQHPPDSSSRHAAHGRKNPSRSSSGKNNDPGGGERDLRRARIVITVQRTQEYAEWLRENPLEAAAGTGVDHEDDLPPSGHSHGQGDVKQPPESFKKKR